MMTVHKFGPFTAGLNTFRAPFGASINRVNFQVVHSSDGTVMLALFAWATVDTTAPMVDTTLFITETNQELPETHQSYVDTVLSPDGGQTVIHAFAERAQ